MFPYTSKEQSKKTKWNNKIASIIAWKCEILRDKSEKIVSLNIETKKHCWEKLKTNKNGVKYMFMSQQTPYCWVANSPQTDFLIQNMLIIVTSEFFVKQINLAKL